MTRLTRRAALKLAGGGLTIAALGVACGEESAAPKVAQVRVEPGDLPAPGGAPLESESGRFFLLNDGEPLALYARCTHRSCLVRWEDDEGEFRCPCHGSRFDRTGQVVNGPADRPLERMAIEVQPDGALLVRTADRT